NPLDGERPDTLLGTLVESQLTPPACVDYGIRSRDAGSLINLTTQTVTPLGDRMSGDYHGTAYGLPQPVRVDGKMQLTGAFLELRDESVGGQLAQRVYLWRFDPDTGRGSIVNDGGGDLDRMGKYVDDWLLDDDGTPIARALYMYIGREFRIEVRKEGKWTPI